MPDALGGPDLKSAEGRAVLHDQVLGNTVAALRAGFAGVVSTDQVLERLG